MKNIYFILIIICIVIFLGFSTSWPHADLYALPKIPEPYNNSDYCDMNINCSLYYAGSDRLLYTCVNMYYGNLSLYGKINISYDTSFCSCNETINKCTHNDERYLTKGFPYIENATCLGSPNVIKFKIKNGGIFNIEPGDLSAYLDKIKIKTTPDVEAYYLRWGNISEEFIYKTINDKNHRTLSITSPAGEVSQDLVCS